MTKSVLNPMESLKKINAAPENEEEIRELVCRILSQDKSAGAKSACLKKLRELENEKLIRLRKAEFSYFDLAAYIKSLCLCSDIIIGQSGRAVSCRTQEMSAAGSPNVLANGFLNLLSNAVKFSPDGKAEVSLKATEALALIFVRSRGRLDLEKCKFKRGLLSAANAAKLHAGSLFLSCAEESVTAVLSISLFLKPVKKAEVPLFPDLLTDDFSCVHIGLSDALSRDGIFV